MLSYDHRTFEGELCQFRGRDETTDSCVMGRRRSSGRREIGDVKLRGDAAEKHKGAGCPAPGCDGSHKRRLAKVRKTRIALWLVGGSEGSTLQVGQRLEPGVVFDLPMHGYSVDAGSAADEREVLARTEGPTTIRGGERRRR